jgi:hypothetical protein
MANETEKKEPEHSDKIAQQITLIEEFEKQYAATPSPELALTIRRRKDTVAHLENLEKGDAKNRAKNSAAKARESVIGRAIA